MKIHANKAASRSNPRKTTEADKESRKQNSIHDGRLPRYQNKSSGNAGCVSRLSGIYRGLLIREGEGEAERRARISRLRAPGGGCPEGTWILAQRCATLSRAAVIVDGDSAARRGRLSLRRSLLRSDRSTFRQKCRANRFARTGSRRESINLDLSGA